MVLYLDGRDLDWPARALFCHKMGIDVSQTPEERNDTGLGRAVLFFLLAKPWFLYRLLPAYLEYCECKLHMHMLYQEADMYRTDENAGLVDHIVAQTGQSLVRESPKDWSELCGLAMQKLAHLQYHDDLKNSLFRQN